MNIEQVARICHAANLEFCESIGDSSQKPWDQAEPWQRESAVKGVKFKLDNPLAAPSAQHDAWCADKIAGGWVFGKVKDATAKTHPCLVPYDQLPLDQRIKDFLFVGIVEAFRKAEAE
jgi:hypothetical protein